MADEKINPDLISLLAPISPSTYCAIRLVPPPNTSQTCAVDPAMESATVSETRLNLVGLLHDDIRYSLRSRFKRLEGQFKSVKVTDKKQTDDLDITMYQDETQVPEPVLGDGCTVCGEGGSAGSYTDKGHIVTKAFTGRCECFAIYEQRMREYRDLLSAIGTRRRRRIRLASKEVSTK